MVLLSRFLPAQVRRLVDGQALQRHRIHGVFHGHQLVNWEISKFKLKTQQKETMMQWLSSFYFKPIHWVTESRNPSFASSWFKMSLGHNLKIFETLQLGQVMFGPWVLGKFSSYCVAGSSDLISTCCALLSFTALQWAFATSVFRVRCPHHQCPAQALMPLCDQLSVCSHLWPTSRRFRMETSAERQVLSHAATPGTSNQIRFHVKCILTCTVYCKYMIAWFHSAGHMISIIFV